MIFVYLLYLTAVSLAYENIVSECKLRDSEIFCKDIKNISSVLDILVDGDTTITKLTLDNCQDFDHRYKDPRFSALYSLEALKFIRCQKGTKLLASFEDSHRLRSLTIRKSFLEKFVTSLLQVCYKFVT